MATVQMTEFWSGEMVQQHLLSQGTRVNSQHPLSASQEPVTGVPEDPILCSGFCRHQAFVRSIYRQAGKAEFMLGGNSITVEKTGTWKRSMYKGF